MLEQAAATHGLLLVLDDLHWADTGTIRLLRHLARTSQRTPALLVACVRDGELGPAAAAALVELRREGLLEDLPLSGLDDDAVGALLAAHTGSADADLARRLRVRTGGNPFFVDELLQDHRERGGSGPPAGVREVVGRRLARLGPEAAEALSLAALVGLEWEVALSLIHI